MLQSLCLKYHVKTIGIDQSLSKNAQHEHNFIQNINKLYKHDGKCDDQQKFKDILEAAMVSTPEVFTNNSPRSPMTQAPFNKPISRKSLCFFTNILYVNKKTADQSVWADKSNRKSNKSGTKPKGIETNVKRKFKNKWSDK